MVLFRDKEIVSGSVGLEALVLRKRDYRIAQMPLGFNM